MSDDVKAMNESIGPCYETCILWEEQLQMILPWVSNTNSVILATAPVTTTAWRRLALMDVDSTT